MSTHTKISKALMRKLSRAIANRRRPRGFTDWEIAQAKKWAQEHPDALPQSVVDCTWLLNRVSAIEQKPGGGKTPHESDRRWNTRKAIG